MNAADRLAAILMALFDAISPIATTASTPTLPKQTAQALFFRLVRLVTTLVRIATFGPPTKAEPPDPAEPPEDPPEDPADPPEPRPTPGPAQRLPRRPGWLLAALPDLAPAIAAGLASLLADPALADLFAADPKLLHTLRPILRGLGLKIPDLPAEPPPEPPPQPDPTQLVEWLAQRSPTPPPPPESPTADPPTAPNPPDPPKTLHAHIITISQ